MPIGAETLRLPLGMRRAVTSMIVDRHREGLVAAMENEHKRATSLCTDAGNGHGPSFRHHRAAARARHDETIGRLETLRSAHDIPRLGTRMTVAAAVAVGLWTTWWKKRFHVARRVCSVGRDVERTNARDLLTGAGPPLGIGYRVEPVSIENVRDRSPRPARCFGRGPCRKLVDMPIERSTRQDAERRLDAQ